ncbi:ComF family protein [Crenobacter sp. SG2305]|uniref:ComF family protein n=1 Tax=Crenobacter oryzisoli TaxID=3056844 RepID=UPI0025AA404B|nr:ComF family protein [Crenobacter sp. SG2305]MDN0081242.1 ComF family protein [Crenobacter sp. SG2305]
MTSTLSNLLSLFIDNCPFFEQKCALCGDASPHIGICSSCQDGLPWFSGENCSRCALPLAAAAPLCGQCQRLPPFFDRLDAVFRFDFPLAGLLHAWKYGRRYELSGVMAQIFTRNSVNFVEKPDLVLPVPLAPARLAERGFNQSEVLARAFADTLACPFSATHLWRKRNTPSQASLTLAERRRNLRDAFGVNPAVKGLHVLLVDDVATSGSTLSALAFALKKQGAKRVDARVLARAIFSKT